LSKLCGASRTRLEKIKSKKVEGKTTISHQAETTNKVKDEVNMPEATKITRPTPYASCEDFRNLFDKDMNSLYQLAFLLTADHVNAEQCFVSGLDDVVKGNPVFKEWARSWSRRAVILNAVRRVNPRPADGNGRGRSSSDQANSVSSALPAAKQAEIAAVLELDAFERFVYVLNVLERYSDQECSVLLGCTRRDVVAARTRAFQQLGSVMETRYQEQPTSGAEESASLERRSSAIQLLATPRLATCT
jgi:DNA-directed RNA polymerase specialized sigma24 family protein